MDNIRQKLVKKQLEMIDDLRQEVECYKELARERGQYILNADEMGCIHKPLDNLDSAYHVFQRCNLDEEHAIKFIQTIKPKL